MSATLRVTRDVAAAKNAFVSITRAAVLGHLTAVDYTLYCWNPTWLRADRCLRVKKPSLP